MSRDDDMPLVRLGQGDTETDYDGGKPFGWWVAMAFCTVCGVACGAIVGTLIAAAMFGGGQ